MNKRILIVEDDVLILEWLKRKLEEQGYEILTVKNEEGFWKYIFDEKLSLVILDICLKNLLTSEVYKTLFKSENGKRIPVIVTAGFGQTLDFDIREIRDEHYVFLPQPLNFEKLSYEVKNFFKEKQTEKAA